MARPLAREPLLHFVVLGALVFAANAWWGSGRRAHVIELGPNDVAALRADHQRRSGRAPTAAEETLLIERFIDDELLYREALRLGLERGDIIVRRRLLQKMEFLLESRAELEPPTLADLEAHRDAHADRYRTAARVDFEHVFVSRERHGDEADAEAVHLRAEIDRGARWEELGEPFPRGRRLRAQSRDEIARIFGVEFAAAVMALEAGIWSRPIRSSYGLHLVRVGAREPARLPPVASIETTLREDWLDVRRAAARREALARLRDRYEIRIQRAPPGEDTTP